jgi:predicted transcriptional regulator
MRKRTKTKAPPPLHELEAEVMEEVWRRDLATVREIMDALNRGPKERAYTTIMTIMVRLDKKGLLTRTRQGKTDIYSTVLSREAYREARAKAEVDALVKEFGDLALAHFSEHVGKSDPERVSRLRELRDK